VFFIELRIFLIESTILWQDLAIKCNLFGKQGVYIRKLSYDILVNELFDLSHNCLQITLEVAPPLEDYGLHTLRLGLGGEHQRINAALAVALCKQWVMTRAPSEHTSGLQKVSF
jgi:hypothetical protein